MAPVMSGPNAEPDCATPAIQPTLPAKSQWGRIVPAWLITIGYKGPMNTPIKDNAIAPPIRDLLSQTTSSKLRAKLCEGHSCSMNTGCNLPKSQRDIEKDCTSTPNLFEKYRGPRIIVQCTKLAFLVTGRSATLPKATPMDLRKETWR